MWIITISCSDDRIHAEDVERRKNGGWDSNYAGRCQRIDYTDVSPSSRVRAPGLRIRRAKQNSVNSQNRNDLEGNELIGWVLGTEFATGWVMPRDREILTSDCAGFEIQASAAEQTSEICRHISDSLGVIRLMVPWARQGAPAELPNHCVVCSVGGSERTTRDAVPPADRAERRGVPEDSSPIG